MKRRFTGFIIAFAIFSLVATGYFLILSEKRSGNDTEPLSTTDDRSLTGTKTSPPANTVANAHSLYEEFSRAKDASSALGLLTSLDTARSHDVIDARLYISGICQGATTLAHPSTNTWLNTALSAYCKDYADTELMQLTTDELLMLQENGTRGKIEQLLESDNSRDQAISSLEDIILYSDSPWEVQSALVIASERQYDLSVYKNALPDNDLTNLRDVLSLTAELQYCQMVRGCGPGSAAAIRGCIFTGYCGPQIDYIAQLRQIYNSSVFADAMALHKNINSNRAQR